MSLHVAEYKNIISDLRTEIEELKAKLVDGGPKNVGHKQLSNNFFSGNDNSVIEEVDEHQEKEISK